jgi:hypothetical protein
MAIDRKRRMKEGRKEGEIVRTKGKREGRNIERRKTERQEG